jgi:hypothetical protein
MGSDEIPFWYIINIDEYFSSSAWVLESETLSGAGNHCCHDHDPVNWEYWLTEEALSDRTMPQTN